MEAIEYDVSVFDAPQAEADKSLLVRFFTHPIQNMDRTAAEGRPIFDDTEMIEIRVRGTKDNVVMRPIRPDDKLRFAMQYRHYKERTGELESGTPLKQWPAIGLSQAEELRHLGFTTVEHLADAKDSVVMSIPGMQSLKNKAKAFLDLSKGVAPIERIQKQLDEKTNEAETLKRQLADVALRMAALEAKQAEAEAESREKSSQTESTGKAVTRR